MQYKTLDDLDVVGKRVMVRVDFNVPMADGAVTDATRTERALPTIEELRAKGAKVILLSHFGRPKGARNENMSLAPVAKALSEKLGKDVGFAEDCIGDAAAAAVAGMTNGDVEIDTNQYFLSG